MPETKPNNTNPKILASIVTYNAMNWIDHCIRSLFESTIHINIFIVDNCSSDDTINYVKSHFPDIVLYESASNIGFGQANNIVFKYALTHNYDYVLLLNQDAWISRDMLSIMLTYSNGNSLLSPIHLNGNGNALDKNFLNNTIIKSGLKNLLIVDPILKNKGVYKVQEVNAACWLLPTNIIRIIGGFNPLFYHYGEDNNYLSRLHYHKIPIYVIAGTYAYHDRENRPELPTDYSKIYRNILLLHTDINSSTLNIHLKQFRFFLAILHTALKEKNTDIIKYYFSAKKEINTNRTNIKNSRTTERLSAKNWL